MTLDFKIRQNKELAKIEKHRKRWMMLSIVVIIFAAFVISDWKDLKQENILWLFGSLGITLAIIWWYWTMKVIGMLLAHRAVETEILNDLYKDIKEIRRDLQKNPPKDLTE